MNLIDIWFYMHSLLTGLAYIHAKKIIHRDIKPSNFLYKKELKTGKLIDFGLAHLQTDNGSKKETTTAFKKPSKEISHLKCWKRKHLCCHDYLSVCDTCVMRRRKVVSRAGTPGYRAPEILIQYQQQTNAIDVWSAGIILLSLLSQRYPFFKAFNDCYALAEIVQTFGSKQCVQAAKRLGISLYVSEDFPGLHLEKICSKHYFHSKQEYVDVLHEEFIFLLRDMLCVNPLCRISAAQALSSKAFH